MNKHYLVLTPIDAALLKDQAHLTFLGSWCINDNDFRAHTRIETLPYLWDSASKKIAAIEYCNQVYENSLEVLTKQLNSIHNTTENTQYYRTILGNWLLHFIHVTYDKYQCLKYALELYPNINIIILDNSQYYFTLDYNDFIQKICYDDRYNYQLYSQILASLKYGKESQYLQIPIEQPSHYVIKTSFRSKIKTKIASYLSLISHFIHNKTITFTEPYLGSGEMTKIIVLFIKSKFKISFNDFKYPISLAYNIDHKTRQNELSLLATDEFQTILNQLLFKNLPCLFLECFTKFRNEILSLSVKQSNLYFTANALHGNNIFKFFVAEHNLNTKLISMQHGASYGTDYINVIENYEKSISANFLTTGWQDKTNTIPFLLPKLHKKYTVSKEYIFFAMTGMPRYLFRFELYPSASDYWGRYLNETINFLSAINNKEKLIIRPYPNKLYIELIKNKLSLNQLYNLKIDNFNTPFEQSLLKCRIFVSDHFGTSVLEALALNKPTIFFINPNVYKFRPYAQTFINDLIKCKILHISPESAAQHLNQFSLTIDDWWKTAEVQKARKKFCQHFAQTSEDWMDQWILKFNNFLDSSQEKELDERR